MKNLVGYTPLQNPDWITLRFEDGTESTPVHDPAGEYRAEADQIAKKIAGVPPDPMQNATAGLGGELAAGAGAGAAKADVVAPTPGALGDFRIIDTPSGAAKPAEQGGDAGLVRGALKTAMRAPAEGGMPAGGAPIAPPAAPATQPAQPPPSAGPGPLVTTGSTSSWQKNDSMQRSSSGISEADLPKVQEANTASLDAQKEANQADYAARAAQTFSEWGRLSEKAKQEIALKNEQQSQLMVYDEKLASAFKKYDEDMKRPIDPAQAFAGEKRWYAFMAGFGDVLRNVGAALAGKGPVVDPGKVLDDLVERSVQLQMAQKEQNLKAGRMNIDQFNAERAYIRGRLGATISQLAETEAAKAQTEQVYKGLGAIKAKGDALVANSGAEYAKATARQETIAESHGSTTGGTTERQVKPAGAGSADDLWKQIQARLNLQELDKTGRTPEQNKEIREETAKLTDSLAPTLDMVNALNGIYRSANITRDADGNLKATGDIPGKGPLGATYGQAAESVGLNQDATALNAALKNAKDTLGRMRSGGAITEAELDTFSALLDAKLEGTLVTRLQQFDRFVQQRAQDLGSRASDGALAEFGRRRDRGTGPVTPAGVNPVDPNQVIK
jgi:hypothetical protein